MKGLNGHSLGNNKSGGDSESNQYVLVVDIGTTNIRLVLIQTFNIEFKIDLSLKSVVISMIEEVVLLENRRQLLSY